MIQPFYTLDDLRHWQDIAPALSPPARLAVIGNPIAHSRSPQMHNPALRACGIDAQYIRVRVPVGHVKEALGLFTQHGFLGVNCTIPHKFEALAAVDEVDPLALALGAVNTIIIRDGKLKGYNSDGPGFLRSVEESFHQPVKNLRVLILGAGGGAGRAVAVQCALEKCPKIVLANRTTEKISSLASELRQTSPSSYVETIIWNDETLTRVLPNVDLIVNATPLGMKPEDAPLFDLRLLQPQHLAYDMVYTSGRGTPFIAAARSLGAKTCDGLILLLHQGAISFEHWFNRSAPIAIMRSGLQQSE